MRQTCRTCGGAMSLQALDAHGKDGPLTLRARGMPVARCPRNHATPIDDDFMLWLIRELKERQGTLPAATAQGMVFKKYLCACGKELAGKSERTQAFPLELAYEGAPAFKVDVEMPVYRCAGCGKEQLRSHKAVRSHTSQAIASLHDAAGFPHSG